MPLGDIRTIEEYRDGLVKLPRYFYQGTGTASSRISHAKLGPFIARNDDGNSGVKYSTLGGVLRREIRRPSVSVPFAANLNPYTAREHL